jgi:hypothetical protein
MPPIVATAGAPVAPFGESVENVFASHDVLADSGTPRRRAVGQYLVRG